MVSEGEQVNVKHIRDILNELDTLSIRLSDNEREDIARIVDESYRHLRLAFLMCKRDGI